MLSFRFAQFFISPLISADGVEREVKAVDSEHGKNLNVDAWRLHQLAKATANQDHAWSHFFTGVCLSSICLGSCCVARVGSSGLVDCGGLGDRFHRGASC